MRRTSFANWPRWLADEAGPPITLNHAPRGHDAEAQVVCQRPDVISRFAVDV